MLIKDAGGAPTEDGLSLRLVATGSSETTSNQAQIAPELAIKRTHQLQSAQGAAQSPQRIACIKHLEGILQRVAPATINRGINLDIPPGEHQQGGPKSINAGAQNPIDIEHGNSGKVQQALRQVRKLLVQMISQIDRTNRENRIAGKSDQQDSLARLDRAPGLEFLHCTGPMELDPNKSNERASDQLS